MKDYNCIQCGKCYTAHPSKRKTCSLKCKLLDTVDYTQNGCWEWTGYTDTFGYGQLKFNSKKYQAHRVAYEIFNNEKIKSNLCVLHACDNPLCINPNHLRLGTKLDNSQDAKLRHRLADTKGELNGRARLTEADIIAIRKDVRRRGLIAEDYSITPEHVYQIKTKRMWRHLT